MIYNIVVTKKAQKEAFQAYLYYEEKQEGLGDRFIDKLEDRYFQLSENPQHYSFIYRDKGRNLRDIKIENFPFVIIYAIEGDSVIVYSIQNTHKQHQI